MIGPAELAMLDQRPVQPGISPSQGGMQLSDA